MIKKKIAEGIGAGIGWFLGFLTWFFIINTWFIDLSKVLDLIIDC